MKNIITPSMKSKQQNKNISQLRVLVHKQLRSRTSDLPQKPSDKRSRPIKKTPKVRKDWNPTKGLEKNQQNKYKAKFANIKIQQMHGF